MNVSAPLAAAYLSTCRFSEDYRSAELAPDGSHAVVAAQPAESHVAAEAPGDTHAVEVAQQGELAEAENCVKARPPGDTAAAVVALCPAVAQAVPVSSAESPADAKAAAVAFAGLPADATAVAASSAALPEDGCSQDASLDTAEAAAPIADWQTADVELAVQDDRCLAERCDSPAEQAYYRERRDEAPFGFACRGRCY